MKFLNPRFCRALAAELSDSSKFHFSGHTGRAFLFRPGLSESSFRAWTTSRRSDSSTRAGAGNSPEKIRLESINKQHSRATTRSDQPQAALNGVLRTFPGVHLEGCDESNF